MTHVIGGTQAIARFCCCCCWCTGTVNGVLREVCSSAELLVQSAELLPHAALLLTRLLLRVMLWKHMYSYLLYTSWRNHFMARARH